MKIADLVAFHADPERKARLEAVAQLHAKKERDSQRSKCYKAENLWFKSVFLPKNGPTLPEVADVELYVAKVWASKRVREAFPQMGDAPRVKDGRGTIHAYAYDWSISIPRGGRYEWIVLHELAHIINGRQLRHELGPIAGRRVAGHGWQYCEVYLKLVLYMLGRDYHDGLKKSFKMHKVRFSEPRKRVMTEEAKQALRERLQLARAAKEVK